jgi:hypothetical protein
MSLDWSTENCAEPLPQTDDEKSIRNGLVWATLGLDLGSIAADNVDEWLFRIWYAHKVGLEFLWLGEKPDPKEIRGWVERWVGMYTNVITRPRKEWLAKMEKILVKDTESAIRVALAKEETVDAND